MKEGVLINFHSKIENFSKKNLNFERFSIFD